MPIAAPSSRRSSRFALVLSLLVTSAAFGWQDDRPQVLFTWLMDVDVPPDSRGGAVDVLAQSWVFLNEATLAQIDPAIADVDQMPLVTVQLFGDIAFTAQVTSARSLWMDVEPWNDEAGVENPPDAFILSADILAPEIGYLVLHSSAEGVFARVHIDGEGSFDLAPDKGTLYIARRITSTNEFECLTDAQAGADGSDEGGVAGSDCPGTAPACTATCDHGCTLDCVILFTTAAKDEATAENKNIRTEILLAIEEANQAFEDSEIDDGVRPLILRPVFIGEATGYSETASCACLLLHPLPSTFCATWPVGMGNMLAGLSNPHLACASIEPYRGLRDALRADLAAIIVRDKEEAISTFMGQETALREHRGFAAVGWESIGAGNWILVHEWGHCLGAGHACNQQACPLPGSCPAPGTPLFACSYAKIITRDINNNPVGPYATIMRTMNDSLPSGTVVINHFSNPDVVYMNALTGAADCRENAPTINATRDTVAKYRTSLDTTGENRMASRDEFLAVQPMDPTTTAAISSSGRYVVSATLGDAGLFDAYQNVTEGNSASDIIRWDRETGAVRVISMQQGSANTANGASINPAISGDGGTIAFASTANNIVAGSVCGGSGTCVQQIIVAETSYSGGVSAPNEAFTRTVASRPDASTTTIANGACDNPSLSFDGSQCAFNSTASNLVTGDTLGFNDVFIRQIGLAITKRYSLNYFVDPPEQANADCLNPVLSPSSRFVSFEADASNLSAPLGDSNGKRDIILIDRDPDADGLLDEASPANVNIRVSRRVASPFAAPNGDSFAPAISVLSDGTVLIVYHTMANDIDASKDPDTNPDVYLFTFTPATGAASTTLISKTSAGVSANGDHTFPSISPDGRFITFVSTSTDIITGLSGAVARVFVYDRAKDAMSLVSKKANGAISTGNSANPVASSFAQFVAFESADAELVPGDAGGFIDVFLRNLGQKGDLNGDGKINATDQTIQNQNWGDCPCCAADLDHDGDVDNADRAILTDNWTG